MSPKSYKIKLEHNHQYGTFLTLKSTKREIIAHSAELQVLTYLPFQLTKNTCLKYQMTVTNLSLKYETVIDLKIRTFSVTELTKLATLKFYLV